jgi:hypothetical protein
MLIQPNWKTREQGRAHRAELISRIGECSKNKEKTARAILLARFNLAAAKLEHADAVLTLKDTLVLARVAKYEDAKAA